MFYGFSSSLLCGFRPPYIIFSVYIYILWIIYIYILQYLPFRIFRCEVITYTSALSAMENPGISGCFDGEDEVFNHVKMLGKTHQWRGHVGKSCFMLFSPTFSGKSPAWHHQGTAWIGELLWTYWERCKLKRLHQICPSASRGMVSASGLNSLLLSCHTEINHEKGLHLGFQFLGHMRITFFFVVLWRLRVVPPFGSINKKDKKVSHGLPPICATNHFCRLTTQFGWLYGGFHTWGYPNSWMEENGQSF